MIALFLPSLRGGGAERNMVNLAGGLAERGHPVALVLARAEGPLVGDIPNRVEMVDLDASRVSAALVPLARFLGDRKPRVLLSTPTHANVVAVWARMLSRTPVRLVLREANTLSETAGNAPSMIGRQMPRLVRWCYPWADAIVAVSRGVADDLRNAAGLSDVCSLPNPAVTPDIPRLSRERVDHVWLNDDGPPVVIAVGSLTPQKDYPTLLRAFRIMRKARPSRLIILGEGDQRTLLERLIRGLSLADDVELPGFVRNPFPYMARADVLALSSRWEGWPNVCAQALAVGTPVVATDCPHGPSEILDDGRFGELVPLNDPTALAQALLRTLRHPPAKEHLQKRAQEFTLERAISAYVEVLGVGKS